MNSRSIKNKYTNTDETVDICVAFVVFNKDTAIILFYYLILLL